MGAACFRVACVIGRRASVGDDRKPSHVIESLRLGGNTERFDFAVNDYDERERDIGRGDRVMVRPRSELSRDSGDDPTLLDHACDRLRPGSQLNQRVHLLSFPHALPARQLVLHGAELMRHCPPSRHIFLPRSPRFGRTQSEFSSHRPGSTHSRPRLPLGYDHPDLWYLFNRRSRHSSLFGCLSSISGERLFSPRSVYIHLSNRITLVADTSRRQFGPSESGAGSDSRFLNSIQHPTMDGSDEQVVSERNI